MPNLTTAEYTIWLQKQALKTLPTERMSSADGIAAGKETHLQTQIVEYCRRKVWQVFYSFTHCRATRPKGEPDLHIWASGGRKFSIELKTKVGKIRPEQVATIHHAERNGHTVHVVRSFAQFLNIVEGEI
jgi:hypothetical protein